MTEEWKEAWAIVEPSYRDAPHIWHVLYRIVDNKIVVKGLEAPDEYASEWPGIHSRSGDIRLTHQAALDGLVDLIKLRNGVIEDAP